jgi:Tfp pilus assembly protein PilF
MMNRTTLTTTSRYLRYLLIGATMSMGVLTTGCEDAGSGVKTPADQQTAPGGQPYVPKQGSGQAQFGVADEVPAGAKSMNGQALTLYRQGLGAFSQGNLKQAEAFFSQATQADSEAFQAWYSLGVVQERLGKSSAKTSYKKSYTVEPKYDRAVVAYGMVLAKTGDLSSADSFLTKRRNKNLKSAALASALAEVKSMQKDTASAQEIAQEALKINPSYAPAMMTIARDHYRNRRLDLSLYALKAVLDGFGKDNPPRDKDNAEGHLLRAFIWAEQDLRVLAMAAFKKTIELRPDLVVARLRYATYLLESGGATAALPVLQKTVTYAPDSLDAHLSLGDAYRLTGDYGKAKQEFDWVRKKDSSLAEVHYNFGLLYLFAPKLAGMSKKKQVLAAIKSFNKFKDLKGKAADDTDVGELLQRANLKKAEIDALEKAKNPKAVKTPPPATPPAKGGAKAAPKPALPSKQ